MAEGEDVNVDGATGALPRVRFRPAGGTYAEGVAERSPGSPVLRRTLGHADPLGA